MEALASCRILAVFLCWNQSLILLTVPGGISISHKEEVTGFRSPGWHIVEWVNLSASGSNLLTSFQSLLGPLDALPE
jgi:hypothetical protein